MQLALGRGTPHELSRIARLRLAPAEPAGEIGAKPATPPPDACLSGDGAPRGEDQACIGEARAEEVTPPHRVPDYPGREAIAGLDPLHRDYDRLLATG